MSGAASFRKCALMALYQIDAQSEADAGDATPEAILANLIRQIGPEDGMPGGSGWLDDAACRRGAALAANVWNARAGADTEVESLAPDWPTRRQPIVDRNILRMGHWEIRHGGVPHAVAIDEAVELAKEFGSERSGAFINGVLDRIAHAGAA